MPPLTLLRALYSTTNQYRPWYQGSDLQFQASDKSLPQALNKPDIVWRSRFHVPLAPQISVAMFNQRYFAKKPHAELWNKALHSLLRPTRAHCYRKSRYAPLLMIGTISHTIYMLWYASLGS